MKRLTKYLAIGGLLAAGSTAFVVARGGIDERVPHYFLDSEMCARYARLAAKDLSGTEYVGANAWDLSKANHLVSNVSSWEDLEGLVREGKVMPNSSILTLYNPNSKHAIKGREASHAVLYVGNNKVAHQEGRWQKQESFNELKSKGYVPREVLAPKER